ncbi:hypothetical protein S83_004852, partial [Arachis hypogaea]
AMVNGMAGFGPARHMGVAALWESQQLQLWQYHGSPQPEWRKRRVCWKFFCYFGNLENLISKLEKDLTFLGSFRKLYPFSPSPTPNLSLSLSLSLSLLVVAPTHHHRCCGLALLP